MADINIQRKKAAPSPWLLVLLAAVALAVAAYFFLRPEPADAPAPAPATGTGASEPDTLAAGRAAVEAAIAAPATDTAGPAGQAAVQESETEAATPTALSTLAAGSPTAKDYARNNLQKLTGMLVTLADRDDLRDPTIQEQRDNLTSATYRLSEPNANLRPGVVAAVGLIRAMQQKAYPDLEDSVNELVRMGGQLSGRNNTPAEQQQNQQFFTRAAETVALLNEPAK